MKLSSLKLPRLSLRRTYLIARRDFVGYVKTWGFWLTTFGPFIGLALLLLGSVAMVRSEPVVYTMIFDETGIHGAAIEQKIETDYNRKLNATLRSVAVYTVPKEDRPAYLDTLEVQGEEAAKEFLLKQSPKIESYVNFPKRNLVILDTPDVGIDELKNKVLFDQAFAPDGTPVDLNGIMHIYEKEGALNAEYWSTSANQIAVEVVANEYFSILAQESYLQQGQLSRDGMRTALNQSLRLAKFNPEKDEDTDGGQEITFNDSLPYIVAAGLSLMLWLTIFTGAYMLLVSMVEEKISKVLEMLLATTRFSEIFVGKLLGVAVLTMVSLLPWIIGIGYSVYAFLNLGDASVAEGLAIAVDTKMYVTLFVFLVLGYLFYGSMFIALGAIAESMQDASTLMTPMVLLMTICMMVVPIGLQYPESPILVYGQWFPFSAPFATIVRLPSDPPWWETFGSAMSLIIASMLVIWISSRIFQQGILSGGIMSNVKGWFSRVLLRKKSSK